MSKLIEAFEIKIEYYLGKINDLSLYSATKQEMNEEFINYYKTEFKQKISDIPEYEKVSEEERSSVYKLLGEINESLILKYNAIIHKKEEEILINNSLLQACNIEELNEIQQNIIDKIKKVAFDEYITLEIGIMKTTTDTNNSTNDLVNLFTDELNQAEKEKIAEKFTEKELVLVDKVLSGDIPKLEMIVNRMTIDNLLEYAQNKGTSKV